MTPSLSELQSLAHQEVDECVVGALIANAEGRLFAHKRSLTRKLFPGCWDIAGGHVEPGETLEQALAREILEETGWQLTRILEPVAIFDWDATENGVRKTKREFDFLVEVTGDLERPQLELGKCMEHRWISPADIEILNEGRPQGDKVIFDLFESGFKKLRE